MTTRCTFRVTYGNHTARFSCRAHAFEFARYIARMSGHDSEVRDVSGLLGQCSAETGDWSAEFAHLDAQGFDMAGAA